MVFEKTLSDLVKGIRASKRDTPLFISSCIAEIKSEINSTDLDVKSNALLKLTFLQMMGYNMSYASFATIEVMSSPSFSQKRIGYLAASQAFTQDTDVILLATNTLKKELRGAVDPGMGGVYEAGLAINCLSNIVTEELARELLQDITNLTMHPQPYLRKKAILCLLKMFMKYPQALRLTFPRIQECLLKDANASVTSCAVNVITELSDKNPRNYLVLAPSFFALLTNSSNNWMLIKVVKLLGSLVPEEPRLARKLLEPLAEIVRNTQAKSLLYEAVYTITLCLPYCRKADGNMPSSVPSIVALCAETLKSFVEEADQNLKYLGLMGFGSLRMSHPKVLSAPGYRPLILECFSDEDVTIRTRALDLVIGLATRKNLTDLVTQLLHHVDMATGSYKIDLVERIIEICSSEKYALVTDFCWYMDVLVILARTKGIDGHATGGNNLGPLVSGQMMDVTLRVLPVRSYAVRRMIGILLQGGKKRHDEQHGTTSTFGFESNVNMLPEVLPNAAFIIGEYSTLIDEAISMNIGDGGGAEDEDELFTYQPSSRGTYHSIIQALTDPSIIDSLPLQTQSMYSQASMKVFTVATTSAQCSNTELEACVDTLVKFLPVFMTSMDTEVQERASSSLSLLSSLKLVRGAKCSSIDPSDKVEESKVAQNRSPITDMTDDLLNLGIGDPSPSASSNAVNLNIPSDTSAQPASSTPGSIASKARSAAPTLKYLFVPDHMKPVSGKAQRKKKLAAPDNIKNILEDDSQHLSCFARLLREDTNGSPKSTIESISFTQQKPLRVQLPISAPMNGGNNPHLPQLDPFPSDMSSSGTHLSATSLPYPTAISSGLNTNNKQKDPFYLNSNGNGLPGGDKALNRFGTIQLGDSDGEGDEINASSTTKRKKKKKKSKKNQSKDNLGVSDLAFLADMGAGKKSDNYTPTGAPIQSSIIDSDDDGDDEVSNVSTAQNLARTGMPKNMNGFDGLARVDLTTPLRDDEVMPVSQHRVVPEHKPFAANLSSTTEEPRKKKKKEKKAKSSKSSRKSSGIQTRPVETSNVPDATSENLLDFGVFSSTTAATLSTEVQSAQSNPINNAFDDLLSLEAPPASILPKLDSVQQSVEVDGTKIEKVSNSRKSVRLWQSATVKPGSSRNEEVSVLYRTHNSKGKNLKVSLRVINQSESNTVHDASIKFAGHDDTTHFGSIPPKGQVEGKHKSGPFPSSLSELKGAIEAVGGTVANVKIVFLTHLGLQPLPMEQDQVAQMLSENQWNSSSAKIENHSNLENAQIKLALMQFLSAAEVNSGMNDDANYMLSARSAGGHIVIILVKHSKKGIKIDTKSTERKIVKALSSELKKIIFG